MKSKKTVSGFFLIAFFGALVLTAPMTSMAHTALRMHGQLVNGGCEAKLSGSPALLHGLKPQQAAAGLKMQFVSRNDACDGAVSPVDIAYTERTTATVDQRAGTVTLTYQ